MVIKKNWGDWIARGFPDYHRPGYITSQEFDAGTASVTGSETTIVLTKAVRSFLIYNDGANAVYFDDDTGVSTSDFKIPAKSWISIDMEIQTLYFICASGEELFMSRKVLTL